MNSAPADIERTVVDFLARVEKLPDGFDADTSLYAGGAGLDSLETAELSATIEDVHGGDPFSAPQMPQTLHDIVAYFGSASVDA